MSIRIRYFLLIFSFSILGVSAHGQNNNEILTIKKIFSGEIIHQHIAYKLNECRCFIIKF